MSRQRKLPFQSFDIEDWRDYVLYEENGKESTMTDITSKAIQMVFVMAREIELLKDRIKQLESE